MKLNKFQEDYVYNTIQAVASQFDGMLKFLSEITQLSEDSFNQFTGKLAKMIFDGTVEEDVLKLSPRLQKKYFESIKEEMKEVFEEEYKAQKKNIEYQLLTDAINYDLYKGYMLNADFNMNPLENMKDYLDIVNAKVNGKDWSDRLWASKKETMEDLNKMVKKLGKGYVTLSEVSKSVRKYQDKNTYAVKRLVRNELVRVQSGVNEKFDKDNGIEWQLFMATLDSRTSDICRSFDGRSFRINDPNKPIPPDGTHIQCRSCLVGIPDKDWRPATRRDNETGEIIPYKAWKEENEVKIVKEEEDIWAKYEREKQAKKEAYRREMEARREAERLKEQLEEQRKMDARNEWLKRNPDIDINKPIKKMNYKELEEKGKTIGFWFGDEDLERMPKDVPIEVIRHNMEWYEKFTEKYPQLRSYPVKYCQSDTTKNALASCNGRYEIFTNIKSDYYSKENIRDMLKDKWTIDYARNRGFHAPTSSEINSTFVHEYGHFLNHVVTLNKGDYDIEDTAKKLRKKINAEYTKATGEKIKGKSDYKKLISEYGATNSTEGWAEAFQEAFNFDGKYNEQNESGAIYNAIYKEHLIKEFEKIKVNEKYKFLVK